MHTKTPKRRFLEKVHFSASSGCWLWQGANRRGYGYFWLDGLMQPAHRVAYELFVGPIPEGLEFRHSPECTRRCVNPTLGHSRGLGTCSQNNLDKVEDGTHNQSRKTHCPSGHEYNEANTYRPPSRPRERMCRACMKAHSRNSNLRKRAQA